MMCRYFSRAERLSFLVATTCLVAAPALAQVPTSADPSKVEQRFDEPKQPVAAEPSSAVPELPRAQAPKVNDSRRFTLKSVAIEGSTVYTQEQLTPVFKDSLGQSITMAEAQALAEKITARYREDGYILSQAIVPPQQISGGTLRIRVIEGFIANVIIEGEIKENSWRSLVATYGDKIRRQKPLNIKTLERYLLLMDDLPGASAKGVVRPSADTFGAADLVVTVAHKTYGGSLTADNRGTKFIGPMQYSATADANSVLGLYERTLFRFVTTSPTSELRFYNLQHEEQLGYEGTRMVLDLAHSRTEPGHTLTSSNVHGDSNSVGLRIIHPVVRSRAENLNTRLVFDYRNTDTDLSSLPLSNDRLSVVRFGAAYDFADNIKGVNLIDASLSRGTGLFNPSESGTQRTRTNGDAQFTKVNLDITRTQALPMGFSLFTAASGQYAMSPLLASEQFSIGGVSYGSAYDPAELSGDSGVAAKAELRYGGVTNWSYLNSYQAFAYYDIGAIYNDDDSEADNNSLASAGLGLRANFVPWLSGSAEVGFPLTKQVTIENDHDPRFFFSLTGRF